MVKLWVGKAAGSSWIARSLWNAGTIEVVNRSVFVGEKQHGIYVSEDRTESILDFIVDIGAHPRQIRIADLQPHWRIFLLFSTSTTTKLVLRPNPLISLIQFQKAFARAAGPLWSRSGTCRICLIVLSSSRTSELGRGLDFPIVDFAPCLAFACWDQIAWAKGLSLLTCSPAKTADGDSLCRPSLLESRDWILRKSSRSFGRRPCAISSKTLKSTQSSKADRDDTANISEHYFESVSLGCERFTNSHQLAVEQIYKVSGPVVRLVFEFNSHQWRSNMQCGFKERMPAP